LLALALTAGGRAPAPQPAAEPAHIEQPAPAPAATAPIPPAVEDAQTNGEAPVETPAPEEEKAATP
jgi:hypothetical protein